MINLEVGMTHNRKARDLKRGDVGGPHLAHTITSASSLSENEVRFPYQTARLGELIKGYCGHATQFYLMAFNTCRNDSKERRYHT